MTVRGLMSVLVMGNLDDIVHVLYSLGTWLEWQLCSPQGSLGPCLTCQYVKGDARLWGQNRRGTYLSPLYARHRAAECQLSTPQLHHKPVLNSAFFLWPSHFFPCGHIYVMKKGDDTRKGGIYWSDKRCVASWKEHHGFWDQKAWVQITLPLTSSVTLVSHLTCLCRGSYLFCDMRTTEPVTWSCEGWRYVVRPLAYNEMTGTNS